MWKKLLTLYTIFGFSLLILVMLSLYSFQRFNAYIHYADAVDHNHELITSLYKLKIAMLETESRQRAFLLFQDTSFYLAYQEHANDVREQFISINNLLADDKEQQKRLFK